MTGIVYSTDVDVPRVVIDTNVLVAASRSGRGASALLLSLVGRGQFELLVSVPLVIEYEDVLVRGLAKGSRRREAIERILDYLCAIGRRQEVFFLWRPQLRAPGDDLVLELAVAGRCDAILTYNKRDFGNLQRFGLEVLTPKEFLTKIGVLS